MMDTKQQIVQLADNLIRDKGYNAFSFHDISRTVGIKTASIHYHFPTKSDLGVAVVAYYINELNRIVEKYRSKPPLEQLDKFLSIYTHIKLENKVCLVGSLATDFNTVDDNIKAKLQVSTSLMLSWVSNFLEEGRQQQVFAFTGEPRTKALMILGNMMAIVQLARLTDDADFQTVKDTIKNELLHIQTI